MKKIGIIIAIIALAFVGSGSDAQHCATPVRQVYHAPAYVAPIVEAVPVYAAQLLLAPVIVPSYTVGIQQQTIVQQQAGYSVPQQQAGIDFASELRSLRTELAAMRGQALPQPQNSPQKQMQPADPTATVSAKNCASCHDRSVAASKAKGVVLFDGQSLVASDALKLDAIDQVLKGLMPPGAKLQDGDVAGVIQEMTARRAK